MEEDRQGKPWGFPSMGVGNAQSVFEERSEWAEAEKPVDRERPVNAWLVIEEEENTVVPQRCK